MNIFGSIFGFLAKGDWHSQNGGALYTGDSPRSDARMTEHTPVYNSVVFYRLPRAHLISTVTASAGGRTRYGIFGFMWTKLHLMPPLPDACGHDAWPLDAALPQQATKFVNRWGRGLLDDGRASRTARDENPPVSLE